MTRYLSDAAIAEVLTLDALRPVIRESLIAQYRGTVERPPRPHLPLGADLEGTAPLGTGLVMPAYIHGAAYFVTKLVGVFEENPTRELPTVQATLIALDARTGQLAGILAGTRITNARTACVGSLAIDALVEGPITLGVLGAGTQARWQTRAIDGICEIDEVRVYAPSASKIACARDLTDHGIDARAVATPTEAVTGADVIVTATTSTEPVFPADALGDRAIVLAVGAYRPDMQELEAPVLNEATQVFADVPEEVAEIGDIAVSDLDQRELLALGGLLAGEIDIDRSGVIVVESVGSAVFDAAATEFVLDRAIEGDIGQQLD